MRDSWGRFRKHAWAPVLGFLLLGTVYNGAGVAQQGSGGRQEPAASSQTPDPPATRRKPRGRLPAYFAAVVSQEQRMQIYEIQAGYNEKVAALRMQIDQLLAQRDKAVDAVLTPEQLSAVNKKRQAADARRRGSRPAPASKEKEDPGT